MIYFDNAATTMQKPPQVADAVVRAMQSFGGVGRGVHGASLAAGMAVYEAREAIAQLLGASSASRVCFASNATEALNTAIAGLLQSGDHAITTAASHNSVLRPLYRLQAEGAGEGERAGERAGEGAPASATAGIELSICPVDAQGQLDYDQLEALFQPNTKLLAVTHASNLTGDIYDVERLAAMAHRHGALIVVDAAQTAGTVPIDQVKQQLDVVCFTGHKALMGPQGTGGLCVADGVDIRPLKVGGSGTHSFSHEHPAFMPECLEAGTLNGHGIAGLAAGVSFVLETGVEEIAAHERALVERFEQGVRDALGPEAVRLYGGPFAMRTGVAALNLVGRDSGEVADALSSEFGICTRAGAHCAPLMHEALGTADQGVVRFSFGWYNTLQEVDAAVEALVRIAARQ